MGTTFIRDDQIRAGIIIYIRSKVSILALVSSDEVRENEWQGTTFLYPNIRVRILRNSPVGRTGCLQEIDIGIQVFSELDSSLEADEIAGIIANEFHDKQFIANGIAFATIVTNNLAAFRSDRTTWRSEVLVSANIN